MAPTKKVLLCVVSGVVVVGVVGWAVGSQVQSPADAAAAHRPPVASLITAGVEKRVLTSTVVTQGTVGYAAARPLNFAGTVEPSQGAASVTQPLVTKVAVRAGREINEGSVLLEVSGRPVLVLKGSVPMYRTLSRGATGDDVRQLQQGLRDIGFPAPVTGTYDAATEHAVSRWYASRHYAPATALPEQPDSPGKGQPPSPTAPPRTAATPAAPAGVTVPSGELIFLRDLPARLTSLSASVGAPATGKIGSVSGSALQVQGEVRASDAQLFKAGATATVQTMDGKQFPASVTALATGGSSSREAGSSGGNKSASAGDAGSSTSGDDGTPATTSMRVTVRNPHALAPYNGQAVKVTVQVGSTNGKALVVPASALSTRADGRAWVRVDHGKGKTADVAVTPGLSVSGEVQVTPAQGGALNSGDQVVIGTRQGGSS
ncbi:peptidoglycan-binding protein [Streptomyces tubercidicus]|uniref:peptidoglycan-binding protein n=1 Tax=Streptomyces tubercidicus TaxID=47759 RepID=UPI0036C5DC05